MDTITTNGVIYHKASVLAKRFHYTTDYIGQLCRQNKVDAVLVGRAWYVNENSLSNHKGDRYSTVRTNEILSKNRHEFDESQVEKVEKSEKIAIYPRLSKTTHRQFFSPDSVVDVSGAKNWMKSEAVYSSDDTNVEPVSLRKKDTLIERTSYAESPVHLSASVTAQSQPEVEITPEPSFKIEIKNTAESHTKLDFTDIPEVFLEGELPIEDLDTEDDYVDTEPVLSTELSVEPVQSRAGVTLRYQPSIKKPVFNQNNPVFEPKTIAPVKREPPKPGAAHFTSRIASTRDTKVSSSGQKSNIFAVAVLVLFAFVIAGSFLTLTGHVVSEGSATRQSISFNLATALEALMGVSLRN